MSEAEFTDLTLKILLPALIGYMFFIIWRLAHESRAGRFGTIVLFLALGTSTLGFIFKEVLIRIFFKH